MQKVIVLGDMPQIPAARRSVKLASQTILELGAEPQLAVAAETKRILEHARRSAWNEVRQMWQHGDRYTLRRELIATLTSPELTGLHYTAATALVEDQESIQFFINNLLDDQDEDVRQASYALLRALGARGDQSLLGTILRVLRRFAGDGQAPVEEILQRLKHSGVGIKHPLVPHAVGAVLGAHPNPWIRALAARVLTSNGSVAALRILESARITEQDDVRVLPDVIRGIEQLGSRMADPFIAEPDLAVGVA